MFLIVNPHNYPNFFEQSKELNYLYKNIKFRLTGQLGIKRLHYEHTTLNENKINVKVFHFAQNLVSNMNINCQLHKN